MADEQVTNQVETTKNPEKNNGEYIFAHGRRKEASARAKLYKGKGQILVNKNPLQTYFLPAVFQAKINKPFILTKSQDAYYAVVTVLGSGKNSQVEAVVHAISRALSQVSPEFRTILKKAGLLTRDPRVKERRKYGLAQKARKGKQSPKR